jgi:acetolactate synthase I/II/III large subunit
LLSVPAPPPAGLEAKEPVVTSSAAQLIVDTLERRGVSFVAGMPGGAVLPLYHALGRSSRIRHVLARHEQAAGFIAQGIARVTGRAGVCIVTSGPGATNVVTALADAKLDSVPLLCIAGQVPTHLIGTDAFQEVPTLEMARPVTKACYFLRSAEDVEDVFAEAFRVAENGRPGPVLIDVPKNVQTQSVARRSVARAAPFERQPPRGSDRAPAYDQAASMIRTARRPLLYLGGGVVRGRGTSLARELVERAGIPATTSLMALGVLPRDHDLNIGMLGMHGARYTNRAIEAADLLVAVGARFDDRATGEPRSFAARARIIHIDIDPRELGKIKPAALAIEDDAASALGELLRRIEKLAPDDPLARRQWLVQLRELKDALPLRTPRSGRICSPYGIMRALGDALPRDAIVTTDVGQHQMWAAQALPVPVDGHWLTSGGLGTMGFGLPAAIGAALACPDRTVVCVTGDGSLLVNLQELATLAELGLAVKIVVLDNAALGMVRQQQELFFARRHVGSRFERATNFVALARAFGIPALDLATAPRPGRALRAALTARGPSLIRVPIEEAEQVLPIVAPGAANIDCLDHPDEERRTSGVFLTAVAYRAAVRIGDRTPESPEP